MADIKLSHNFYLSEFIKSETALHHGLDNMPGPQEILNIKAMCEEFLQLIRSHFNRKVIITSGYRSEEVNKLVPGAASDSHHMAKDFFAAADFYVDGIDSSKVVKFIADWQLPFEQLIVYPTGRIHIGFRRPKREMLKTSDSSRYSPLSLNDKYRKRYL